MTLLTSQKLKEDLVLFLFFKKLIANVQIDSSANYRIV
jgi:hypothetical protein